jgi:branched-chain amino acid transport system ATP-binding protein
MTSLLQIDGVTVRFGGVTALDDVSFAVKDGELLGLIGPNGAGKTTLLRAVTGVVTPDAGSIGLAGKDITRLPTHIRVRLGLGLSQQLVRPFKSMTVLENVALAAGHARSLFPLAALLARSRAAERETALKYLDLVGIADVAEGQPANLPLGTLKRLEVARALALEPRLLLLDEPLAGLNHVEAARMADTIAALNMGGLTVILIEHNLSEVLRVCSRLVVLDNGRCIGEGEPRAVMADARVRAAYLGAESDHAAA